jgi:uncharacterized repeat protein (TIGR01451 family)
MDKQKTKLAVASNRLIALIPKMDKATKHQMLSFVSLVMITIVLTPFVLAGEASSLPQTSSDTTVTKIVTDVAGQGPGGNVTKAGDIISYLINVTTPVRIGNLANVKVTDPMINLFESATYTGDYKVTQDDLNSNGHGTGFINNTATFYVKGQNPQVQTSSILTPIIQNPSYTINETINVAGNETGGNVTKAGDILSYQFVVVNDGNIELNNLSVNDTLVSLTEPNNSVIDVGENLTYTGNYTVTQDDMNSNGNGTGFINNTVTVDCDQLGAENYSFQTPIIQDPSYTVNIIVADVNGNGPGENIIKEGDVISYQIEVINNGNIDLNNVTVTDPLVNLIGPIESNSNDTILNVGENWTYTGNYTITRADITNNDGGGFINNVTVYSGKLDPKSASVAVPIDPSCSISTRITDVAGRGPSGNVTSSGDLISYQIDVTNNGKVDLSNVTVDDTLTEVSGSVDNSRLLRSVHNPRFLRSVTNPSIDIHLSDGVLKVGETITYLGNYTTSQADINNNETQYIKDTTTVNCDQLGPKSVSSMVPIILSTQVGINDDFSTQVGINDDCNNAVLTKSKEAMKQSALPDKTSSKVLPKNSASSTQTPDADKAPDIAESKILPVTNTDTTIGGSSGNDNNVNGESNLISSSSGSSSMNKMTAKQSGDETKAKTNNPQNTVSTPANVKPPMQRESPISTPDVGKKTSIPGFEIVCGITALLAVFLCRRK